MAAGCSSVPMFLMLQAMQTGLVNNQSSGDFQKLTRSTCASLSFPDFWNADRPSSREKLSHVPSPPAMAFI